MKVRDRFVGDASFEAIHEEVERMRIIKDFVKTLKVCMMKILLVICLSCDCHMTCILVV